MQESKLLNNPVFKKTHCTLAESAKLLLVLRGTIEYYTDKGVLPYTKVSEQMKKHYHKEYTKKRLNEIQELERQGKTIEEIQHIYTKDVKEHRLNTNLWSNLTE